MNRVVVSQKSYAAAYRCDNCPQSNGPDGCPKWTEMLETNDVGGEERITCGCIDQLMPNIAVHLIKSANRPAAEISRMRDQVSETVARAAEQMILMHAPAPPPPRKVTMFGRLRLAFGGES